MPKKAPKKEKQKKKKPSKEEIQKAMLENMPELPGVYIMKNRRDVVLYVGKAIHLKKRVSSYFSKTHDDRPLIQFLVPQIASIETIITDTEQEALLVENALIKKYKPKYNILLRDDKNYLSLRLDLKSEWPRLEMVRKVKQDGAFYLGPFISGESLKETVNFLQKVFPLRSCSDHQLMTVKRPCLEYHVKRCVAPCVRYVTKQEYAGLVKSLLLFLRGKNTELLNKLHVDMQAYSDHQEYEKAAKVRDQINAIERTLEKQKVLQNTEKNIDVIGCYEDLHNVQIQLLFIRKGMLMESRGFFLRDVYLTREETLESFLNQHYREGEFIPDEILLPFGFEGRTAFEDYVKGFSQGTTCIVAQKPTQQDLVDLAAKNAKAGFDRRIKEVLKQQDVCLELQRRLKLRRYPRRIECFDISHLQGTAGVASMVVFLDGQPAKDEYRKYRLKTVVNRTDDFAAMKEVLGRRFENDPAADLLMVDGGKGQLNVALAVLTELGVTDIDVVALAKARSTPGRDKKESAEPDLKEVERIYKPNQKNPIVLKQGSAANRLLEFIRDEAHRFAIAYHRTLKNNLEFQSELDNIEGVGEKKKRALLAYFMDMEKIKTASVEELLKVEGINERDAEAIHSYFRH